MASIERPNDPASRAFRRFREHGDPAGLTEVFDLVGRELFALAAHIARDAAEAEDLVQEVFLAALAGARRFDPSRAVTPWLVGILVKEAQKARRGRARREGPRTERTGSRAQHDGADETQRAAPPTAAPLAMALSGEVRLAIKHALEGVPARYREVLRPVLEDGVAPTVLAATLGRAPGTVRAQLHRGLELLRKALPHTLAPALVPPLVSTLALELGAGRGLAAIRADLERRAALEGPRLALAGAGVLVTPSLPLLGVVVMQTKILAAVAATALVGVALLVERFDGAQPTLEPMSALASPTDTSLVAVTGAVPESAPEPSPIERSAVATTEPENVAAEAASNAMATVDLRVVDELGLGLAREYVSLLNTPAEAEVSRRYIGDGVAVESQVGAASDASGWLTMQVPAGRPLELRCSGGGGRSGAEPVHLDALAPGGRAEALIRLRTRPDVEVEGRVVDAATGEPLEGVAVHITEQRGNSSKVTALPLLAAPHAVTDGNGSFRSPARSWLTTGALFTRSGWSPQLALLRNAGGRTDDETSIAPNSAVEVALRPAARIEGTVSGGRPGLVVKAGVKHSALLRGARPAERATVEGFGREFELTAIVDARCAFVLEDVPAGVAVQLSLVEVDDGAILLQEPSALRLDPGATHHVAWTLVAGGRFVCTVRETDGAPGVDEELWLVPADKASIGAAQLHWTPIERARSDHSGVATFEDVQPGSWIVALAPEHLRRKMPVASARYAVAATMGSSGEIVPVDFTLHRDLWITGRVLAPDGSLVPSPIFAGSADYLVQVQWQDFVDGVFRIGPLMPGRYTLTAWRPTQELGGPPLMESEPVEAEAGATDVELRLRLGAAVVIKAVDPESAAALAATVEIVGKGGATGTTRGDVPIATFTGHEPGTYVALAFTSDGRAGLAFLTLQAGERREVSVPVFPGGSLLLRHSGPTGKLSCRIEHAGARVASHSVERGTDKLVALPAGTFDLHLSIVEDTADDGRTTLREELRRVDVTAGVELVVDLGP